MGIFKFENRFKVKYCNLVASEPGATTRDLGQRGAFRRRGFSQYSAKLSARSARRRQH